MKKLYWRPRQFSRTVLLLIALGSVAGLVLVENWKTLNRRPHEKEKIAAARLAQKAFEVVKTLRVRKGIRIQPKFDPHATGVVGAYLSYTTSVPGTLSAKQTSVNPNWAAVVVSMLKRLKLEEGDTIALGYSGSFPALNISVLAAVKTLKLRPVIVASAASSGFGANHPRMLWLDMEAELRRRGLWDYKAGAASLGGLGDEAIGMSDRGKRALRASITRRNIPLLSPESFKKGIDERMRVFEQLAKGAPIKAYVNVGGGTISVGTSVGKKLYRPGINRRIPEGAGNIDSVMTRFSKTGVPLIHMVEISKLADRYGLPRAPTKPPQPGEGRIFARAEYNPWLTGFVLLCIVGALLVFIRSAWGQRLVMSGADLEKGGLQPSV